VQLGNGGEISPHKKCSALFRPQHYFFKKSDVFSLGQKSAVVACGSTLLLTRRGAGTVAGANGQKSIRCRFIDAVAGPSYNQLTYLDVLAIIFPTRMVASEKICVSGFKIVGRFNK
jgi:hypothetical protein